MSTEHQLREIENKVNRIAQVVQWLAESEEARDYGMERPDQRHPSPLVRALREVAAQVNDRISLLEAAFVQLKASLEPLMIDVTAIQAAVDRAAAGIDSVIALLETESTQIAALGDQVKSLSDQLAAAIAANDPAAQQAIQDQLTAMAAKLDAEADAMDAEKAKIAGATQTPPTP